MINIKIFEKIKVYKNETIYSFLMKESSFDEKESKINEFILFLLFLFHYFPLIHRKSSISSDLKQRKEKNEVITSRHYHNFNLYDSHLISISL